MITDITNSDQSTPISINKKKRKEIEPRSWVWLSYATKTSKASGQCNICLKVITIYNGSPAEIAKHLIKVHNITENSIEQSRISKKICLDFADLNEPSQTEDSNSSLSDSIPKIEKIHQKLIKFILTCNLPFNIVESEEFQDFINMIRPDFYKLPCRQTLRYNYLPNMVYLV